MVVLAAPPPADLTPDAVFAAAAHLVPDAVARFVARNGRLAVIRDDLAQAALIRLWEDAPGYNPALASLRSWAGQRVEWAMADHVRGVKSHFGMTERRRVIRLKDGHRPPTCLSLDATRPRDWEGKPDLDIEPAAFDADPADDPAAELVAAIRSTGAQLDTRQRSLLVEYLTTERTLREIGRRHDLSESRVSQVVTAAVSTIREAMHARGMRGFN